MSFADRVDRDLEERDAELWDEHTRGAHDDEYEPDCARCQRGMREAIPADWEEDEEGYVKVRLSYENREGDPAFNGAFSTW